MEEAGEDGAVREGHCQGRCPFVILDMSQVYCCIETTLGQKFSIVRSGMWP